MLDNNGEDTISYKELVLTMRISKSSGVAMKAREGLELVDILRKIAFVQVTLPFTHSSVRFFFRIFQERCELLFAKTS
jgi:hypothetical protein